MGVFEGKHFNVKEYWEKSNFELECIWAFSSCMKFQTFIWVLQRKLFGSIQLSKKKKNNKKKPKLMYLNLCNLNSKSCTSESLGNVTP